MNTQQILDELIDLRWKVQQLRPHAKKIPRIGKYLDDQLKETAYRLGDHWKELDEMVKADEERFNRRTSHQER